MSDKDLISYIKSYYEDRIITYTKLNEHDRAIGVLINENERLNNIINEFDKWLLEEKMMFYKSEDGERLIRYCETKSKWLELKDEDEEK